MEFKKLNETLEYIFTQAIHYSWLAFIIIGGYLGSKLINWFSKAIIDVAVIKFEEAVKGIFERLMLPKISEVKHDIRNQNAAHVGHYQELKSEFKEIKEELSRLKNENK